MKIKTQKEYRVRRHLRLRRKVQGTAARPRMSVFVSNQHLYVQFIDDAAGQTLAAVSSATGALKSARLNVETATALGQQAAEAALAKGINTVVFDRGGFAYGARLKALADAAREGGLTF